MPSFPSIMASGLRALHGANSASKIISTRLPVHLGCWKGTLAERQSLDSNKLEDEEEHQIGKGSIEVIVGPMFCGKTQALIGRVEKAQQAGRNVIAVKSAIDSRYAKTKSRKSSIVCHNGRKMKCYSVHDLAEVEEHFSKEYGKSQLVAIDEAQFFPDLVTFCSKAADIYGKDVCVAGLDGDYKRQPFKLSDSECPIANLLPMADKVTKLLAECELCGAPAPFTLRRSDDQNEILIGGADLYVPVCRRHYILGMKRMNEAQ